MKFALGVLLGSVLVVAACGANSAASGDGPASSARLDCAGKPALQASGSITQQGAIEQFGYAYGRACPGRTLGYDANGSAAGVEEFLSGSTDLAGSDAVLDPVRGQPERAAARCGAPAWHLPTVFTPIAITYNVAGVGALNLDAATAAKIFSGSIASWDHPAIKALNAGITLPPTPIHVIFRSDRSASTATLQKYLDDASEGGWIGATGDIFTGPIGEGAAGDDGTAAVLVGTDGAVTYTEWPVALGKRLHMARISTTADPGGVAISADSVAKTITGASFAGQGNESNDLVLDLASLYQPAEAGAYPIVLPTYEIICSKYPDAATGAAVRTFLQAAFGPGQDGLEQYGVVPLPQSFTAKLLTTVHAVE